MYWFIKQIVYWLTILRFVIPIPYVWSKKITWCSQVHKWTGSGIFWVKSFRECSQTRACIHTHTHTQTNYLNHWPTLNIASPDLHSAFQNWHDGVIWDSTPPLIASDEGMVDRWSHAQKTRCGSHRTKGLRLDGVAGGRWWGVYQSGGGQLFLICTKCTIISIKSFNRIILVQIWRLSAVDCSEKTKKRT